MSMLYNKIVLFIGFQLLVLLASAQSLQDTIFIKKNIGENQFEIDTLYMPSGRSGQNLLIGTTFLPATEKHIRLLNNGIRPINLQVVEECDETFDPRNQTAYPIIEEAIIKNGVLTIKAQVVANCCHNFLGEAEKVGCTLLLTYLGYGNFCACECCFTLEYILDVRMAKEYGELTKVQLGKKVIDIIQNEERR